MPELLPVEPTGDFMVYLVRSDRNPKIQYRVDLLANKGAGHCACVDWPARRQPKLDEGHPAWTQASSCKHARRAAWFVLKEELKRLAAIQDNPANTQGLTDAENQPKKPAR